MGFLQTVSPKPRQIATKKILTQAALAKSPLIHSMIAFSGSSGEELTTELTFRQDSVLLLIQNFYSMSCARP
jgi:hypothetical protein